MKKAVIITAVMLLVCSLVVPGDILSVEKLIYVTNPRAHIVGTDTTETWGLVHNFPNYSTTVTDSSQVASGTLIKFLTGGGPQNPGDGCEGFWYENAPDAGIGFEYILYDWAPSPDTVIATSSRTWAYSGSEESIQTCRRSGQVVVSETYSGSSGTEFLRLIKATTVVVQGSTTEPDTTASVRDFIYFVIEIE